MSTLYAAMRIIVQSFGYRIRMREANNLAVSISMMVAFMMPWDDLIYRCVFALILNVYVYLINDYCDVKVDLKTPGKDHSKTLYMARHKNAALAALLCLAAILLGGAAFHSLLLVAAFVSNTVLIYVYSAWLKGVPIVDLLMMALAGATMTMVGVPVGSVLGWKLLGLLSLLCCCYEAIQVIRDEPADKENGVNTTAVLLGVGQTGWIYRTVMIAAAGYGFVVVGSPVPAALILAALLPLSAEKAGRSWDLVRGVSGLVWLGLMAQIYLGYL